MSIFSDGVVGALLGAAKKKNSVVGTTLVHNAHEQLAWICLRVPFERVVAKSLAYKIDKGANFCR
jgi:hypothetical protein